jgi:hypothetical protein
MKINAIKFSKYLKWHLCDAEKWERLNGQNIYRWEIFPGLQFFLEKKKDDIILTLTAFDSYFGEKEIANLYKRLEETVSEIK